MCGAGCEGAASLCVRARARRCRERAGPSGYASPGPLRGGRDLNWRGGVGLESVRVLSPRQRLCLPSRGLNWGIGAGSLPLPAIDAGAQPIRRGPYHSSIHPPGFIGGRLGVCRQLAGGLSVWWGGFRDRSASMPPYLPVPRWRDPAPASGAIARSVTTPAGATRSDRRRHRRGRRHGVDSVVAGRGVGRDMGDATNALLQWPETRSVQLVAPPRPASPAAAPRRAAASRRHAWSPPPRRTYVSE